MAYIPVAKRQQQPKRSYVPVAQRNTQPATVYKKDNIPDPVAPVNVPMETAKGVGNWLKGVAQGTARSFINVAGMLTQGTANPTFAPKTGFEKAITGKETAFSPKTEGKETLSSFGVPEGAANTLGLPVGIALSVLDVAPTPKLPAGTVKRIARTKDVAEISKTLRAAGVAEDIIPEAAKKLATISDEAQVQKALESIKRTQATTSYVPVSQRTTTAGAASQSVPGTPAQRLVPTPAAAPRTPSAAATPGQPLSRLSLNKVDNGKSYTNTVGTPNSPVNRLTDDIYAANRAMPPDNGFKKTIANAGSQVKKGVDYALGPISTRLKNINPVLKDQLRKFEFNVAKAKKADLDQVKDWVDKTKKMDKGDYKDLDLALKNSDKSKIDELVTKYGMQKEYSKLRTALDKAYERAKEVGYDVGYTKDYHPRQIADPKGYLEYMEKGDDWGVIQRAIEKKESKLGRQLSLEERAYVANSMVRGYPTSQISLSTPGALKSRSADVITGDINRFYKDSNTSLREYIENVNDAVEGRKFFGKGPKGDALANVDESIGSYVDDLIRKGLVKRSQEEEIKDILFSRFNPGRMNGVLSNIKNAAYIDVMGSISSTLTQLQDFGMSMGKNGFWNTLKAALSEKGITVESLGLQKHIAQFDDASTMAKAVDKVFTATGLNKLDRLAKETYLNAAWAKVQGEAKNPSLSFMKKMDLMFGDESDEVIRTIQRGEIDDNVKLMMFNDLLDVAPVALSEFPEAYLRMGNGKLLYMLKSYTIKQLDVYRNDVFQLIKTDPTQAAINFTKLTGALVAMGVTADEIKEFVFNKEDVDLSDKVANNVFKLMGFNRYTVDRFGEKGVGGTLKDMLSPPTRLIDNVATGRTDQVPRSIPVVGELYYWWMGAGSDDEPKKTNNKSKTKLPSSKPKLPSSK